MPAFIAALLGGLISIAGTIAGRVLVGLGFAIVSYSGVGAVVDQLVGQLNGALSGLPQLALQIIVVAKVPEALNLIISSLLARATLDGLQSDVIKRLVLR